MTDVSLADIAAVTRDDDGGGFGGGGGAWIVIILFALIFGFGGGGWGGNGNGGNATTQSQLQAGFDTSAITGKLDRLGDGISSLGYQLSRDMCSGFAANTQAINAAAAQAAQCCCETQRAIDGVRYDGALHTATITSAINDSTRQILDRLCADREAALQGRIQSLELQQALCGVIRYPTATTWTAGTYPPSVNL